MHFLNGGLHGLRVHVGDHNVSPFAPKTHCDGFPDSMRRTYNECDLILKTPQIVCLPIAHAQTRSQQDHMCSAPFGL